MDRLVGLVSTGPGTPRPGSDAVEDAALLGWAALGWLPGPAPARRAAFDEWRLAWPLAGSFAARGLDDGAARAAAERTRFLVGLPLPGEVGPPRGTAAARVAALVEAWLADPELRASVGHHGWEGVDYVDAEGWGALAAATAELAALADPSAAAARTAATLGRRLASVAGDAGYRVDVIRASLPGGSVGAAAPSVSRPGRPAGGAAGAASRGRSRPRGGPGR
jgi:hypothetical protein